MIDRREHSDDEKADTDLQRCLRESRGDRTQANANEEDAHHAVTAPFIGQPAGRQREDSEGEKSGRRIRQKRRIGDAPFLV